MCKNTEAVFREVLFYIGNLNLDSTGVVMMHYNDTVITLYLSNLNF